MDSEIMSRPSFSIRRFISQHKPDSVEQDDDSFFPYDMMGGLGVPGKEPKSKTWPKGNRKGPIPHIEIRRSEDIHRITNLPPLPDTPKSWTSSLYSCNDHTSFTSPRSPPLPPTGGMSPYRTPERSPQRSPQINSHSNPQMSPQGRPQTNPQRSPQSSPQPSPQMNSQRSPQWSPFLAPQQIEQPQRYRTRSFGALSPPQAFFPHSPPSSPPLPQLRHERSAPELKVGMSKTALSTAETSSQPTPTRPTSEFHIPPTSTSQEVKPSEYSKNVQQLIIETDEAFRTRHSIADPKLSSPLLSRFGKPGTVRDSGPLSRRTSQKIARSKSLGSPISPKSPTKPPMKSQLVPSTSRVPSGSRTKRAKSKKTPRRPRAKTTSKWAFPESAKDLLTIRIFHRIEADEMLPESVLHEIRMSRATQSQLARAAETVNKESDVDDTSSQSDRSGSLDVPSIIVEDSAEPRASISSQGSGSVYSQDSIHEMEGEGEGEGDGDRCPTPKQEHQEQAQVGQKLETQPQPSQMLHYGNTSSNHLGVEEEGPPPIPMVEEEHPPAKTKSTVKNMLRRLPNRQMPPLPTIPEIIATENDALSPTSRPLARSQSGRGSPRINKDDYIFLRSTPYTLTVPTFRHGSIRLAKADLPIGKLAAAVDDTLDWTAFQMAIIGGAGDFFGESTDYSRPSDMELDERDDLAAWFAEFGFASAGALVSAADAEARRNTPPVSPGTPRGAAPLKAGGTWTGPAPRSPGLVKRVDPPSMYFTPGHIAAHPPPGSPGIRVFPGVGSVQVVQAMGGFQHFAVGGLQPRGYSYSHPNPRFSGPGNNGSGGGGSSVAQRRSRDHVGLAIDASKRISTDSVQSLPQSPMLDLVVSRDIDGNEYVVPMGFNLSHDLGDFLNWEAEHVFAAGYQGPGTA
ncbi:hypothetical protein B0H67DRAFT_76344 [Lasiosphaeris hirsuta]|uniref:Uncharacterized protein n=1 Tax=Lasiosphaeris hirsuta TaxID=260670 RepID=A0AA40E7W0_9PEZI|nr:hypothetical protein B0H67DRAFT_76344 [Lasiosphaeris hirsuta]